MYNYNNCCIFAPDLEEEMTGKFKNTFVKIGDIPKPYYCDREVETKRIIQTVTNEGNIVLISPQRMGKSRLAKHVFKQPQIADYYQTFYIDLLHTSSIREFAYTFGRTVFDPLKSRSEEMLQSLVSHWNRLPTSLVLTR